MEDSCFHDSVFTRCYHFEVIRLEFLLLQGQLFLRIPVFRAKFTVSFENCYARCLHNGLGGRGSADGGGGSCGGIAGLRLRKASCAHGEDCPERCNSVEEERQVLEWEGWASARSVDPSSVIR
ncbi:hypothetical protein J1605_015281 [Eschrichtius robustus]|uniref:Uncharacterized protein n=1 Tax=Eschrichtius robustus TaxID=9764 RepID=A0AB34GC79_ESCRO|nr:hypothetical protein J1605_015281 [Eschrichtius robustus]